jgi:Molecular chaperone (small heat shock protein)
MKGGNLEMVWQDSIWNEMNRIQRQMDRLFGAFLAGDSYDRDEMLGELSADYRRAFANFKETDKEYVIQVELPGVEKDEIQLNVTDTGIEVKAESKHDKEKREKDKSYRYMRSYAGFYQAFNVPDDANLEDVDASYKNGMLTIRLAKKLKPENKKTIQIK